MVISNLTSLAMSSLQNSAVKIEKNAADSVATGVSISHPVYFTPGRDFLYSCNSSFLTLSKSPHHSVTVMLLYSDLINTVFFPAYWPVFRWLNLPV